MFTQIHVLIYIYLYKHLITNIYVHLLEVRVELQNVHLYIKLQAFSISSTANRKSGKSIWFFVAPKRAVFWKTPFSLSVVYLEGSLSLQPKDLHVPKASDMAVRWAGSSCLHSNNENSWESCPCPLLQWKYFCLLWFKSILEESLVLWDRPFSIWKTENICPIMLYESISGN